ncbi:MAG: hypothetical protein OXQ29_01430, partial [Rhodospirillaceae bacterium]|nr:hypothetical protein [Rhodospirillaceae bacterium]
MRNLQVAAPCLGSALRRLASLAFLALWMLALFPGLSAPDAAAQQVVVPKPEIRVLSGQSQSSVTEGDTIYFSLLSDITDEPVTVHVTVSQSGLFVPGAHLGSRKVTIPANTHRGVVEIPTTDDRSSERGGSVTLAIRASPDYTISGEYGSATVKVLDNDVPTVSISGGPAIEEGNVATFTLTASPPPVSNLQVRVDVSESGGFAASGQTGARTVTVGTDGKGTLRVSTVRDDRDEADGSITASIVRAPGHDVDVRSASVAVTDGGAPTPRIRISGGPAIEEGNVATFTLTASPPPASSLQVRVDVSDSGSFASGGQTGARTVTVGTDGRGVLRVATVRDDRDEADGGISATLLGGSGYTLGTPVSARVDVTDGGSPTPRVNIFPRERVLGEGATALFSLTASPAPEVPIEVTVDVVDGGSFLAPGDTGRRTVTVGTDGRGVLLFLVQRDDVEEADAFITVSVVRQGEHYAPGSRATARIEVRDDDADATERETAPAVPRISILPGTEIQEGGAAVFGLTASPAPEVPIEVVVVVSETGRFATSGQTGRRTVTIGTGGTGFFTVTTDRDDVDEPDGAIEAAVATGTDYDIGAPVSARVDVTDGGAPTPRIGIAPGPAVVEGAPATFTLTADPAPESILAVAIRIAALGDVAGRGQTGARTVAVGTDGTASFRVITAADGTGEAGGSIVATVQPGEFYAVGFPVSARVGVIDGDASRPMVSIDPGATLIEGDTAMFTLRAVPAPEADITVDVEVSERGLFSGIGQTGTRTVTIGTDGMGVLTVGTEDDGDDEHDGSITAAIRPGANYLTGFPDSATVTVNDNDAAAVDVAVSVSDAQAVEGEPGGLLRFGVTLDRPSDQPVLVVYELYGTATADTASATAGVDYRHTGRFVRIPPGETVAQVMVRIIDDGEDESQPETLRLTVTRVHGGEIADGSAIGTILPDPRDAGPGTPVITISSGRAATEGEPAVFTLRATPAPVGDLPVRLVVLDAGADSDFLDTDAEGARIVIVPGLGREASGNREAIKVVALDTVDDGVDEESGAVEVRIRHSGSGPGHYVVGSPWRETVIVHDNDGQQEGHPEISVDDASGSEAVGRLRFEVTVDPPAPGPVSVDFRTVSGSATVGEDYVHRSGTLTIDAHERSGHVDIALLDDADDEPDETLRLVLSRAHGAAISDGEGLGTIVDSVAMLSIDDATAREGRPMTFAVRLSKPLDRWVAVRLATRETRPVSARAGEDFIPRSPTIVWFGPGETVRKLQVVILDDSHDEGTETFEVVLSEASGVPIGDGVAVGTIVNDDPMPA